MSRYWIYTFLCVLGFISCNNPNRKKIDSASAQQDSIVVRTIVFIVLVVHPLPPKINYFHYKDSVSINQ